MRPEGVGNRIYRFALARHDLVPEAELAGPVVAVNGAACWHGLRTLGSRDKPAGFRQLAQMSWDRWRSRGLAPMQRRAGPARGRH